MVFGRFVSSLFLFLCTLWRRILVVKNRPPCPLNFSFRLQLICQLSCRLSLEMFSFPMCVSSFGASFEAFYLLRTLIAMLSWKNAAQTFPRTSIICSTRLVRTWVRRTPWTLYAPFIQPLTETPCVGWNYCRFCPQQDIKIKWLFGLARRLVCP